MLRYVLPLFLIWACAAKHKSEDPIGDRRREDLAALYLQRAQEAREQRHPENGWLTPDDCDGMVWTGKYATTACDEVNIEAAEIGFRSGRFGRRPSPCWVKGAEHNESASTWSKDMAMGGLFPFILRCNRLDLIERHIAYGEHHFWIMGEPIGDGRALYTPQLIGLAYAIRQHLGGEGNAMTKLPKIWPSGLIDYQAHLQVMAIWMESLIGGISDTMLKRLYEHQEREPYNPLFQYMIGKYSNNQEKTLNLLLDQSMPMSRYVRCGYAVDKCKLAEWLFVADLLLGDKT